MKCNDARRRSRAVTLIELMAVIALVSMIAGLATAGLVAGTIQARLRAVAADWRSLDGYARLVAAADQPLVMVVDPEGREVRIVAPNSGERMAGLTLPPKVVAEVTVENGTVESNEFGLVTFDRSGRSQDYSVSIRVNERGHSWRVYGLTGFIVAEAGR